LPSCGVGTLLHAAASSYHWCAASGDARDAEGTVQAVFGFV